MSDKETKKDEEIKEPEAIIEETSAEATTVEEPAEEAKEAPKTPEPTAIGNEKIEILKHEIHIKDTPKESGDATQSISIGLTAKNISGVALGSVVFEVELYDIDGNTLDKIEKKVMDLSVNSSRSISIDYSKPEYDKVKSYCVKVGKIAMTPEPKMTGNEKVQIVKHDIVGTEWDLMLQSIGVDAAIHNVSDVTIATLVFEVALYNIEGNMQGTFKHTETDLKPNGSRAIMIRKKIDPLLKNMDWFASYDIKVARMTTADYEKVQLRRHEMRTTGDSTEVKGVVKNLSNEKTDSALAVTFLNSNDENIGVRVMIIKDIEPNKIKQFALNFKPMEGDKVKTCKLDIGEIVE